MSFYPITSILSGYGLLFISEAIPFKKRKNKNVILLILTILLIALFIPHAIKASILFADNAHKLETLIPEKAEIDIPGNCVIIANLPSILTSTTNLNVVDIVIFLKNSERQKEIMKQNSCLLFFEDYTCLDWNMFDFENNCNLMKERFNLTPFILYQEEMKKYTFYKLHTTTEKGYQTQDI